LSKKFKSTLNNPSLLKSLSKDDGIIQVVIETPKGIRNNTPSTKSNGCSRLPRSYRRPWRFPTILDLYRLRWRTDSRAVIASQKYIDNIAAGQQQKKMKNAQQQTAPPLWSRCLN
jgi:hypothetical protein